MGKKIIKGIRAICSKTTLKSVFFTETNTKTKIKIPIKKKLLDIQNVLKNHIMLPDPKKWIVIKTELFVAHLLFHR